MAMRNFRTFFLSGNQVSEGIELKEGKITVWGGPSCTDRILCYGTDPSQTEYFLVNVGHGKDEKIYLRPTTGEPDSEQVLVLVHEYSPGSGAKRWPSFHVDWDNAGPVEKLCSASRGAGSGSDTYSLALAPIGWAENIASQFINERDYGGQTVGYNPNFSGKPFGDSDLLEYLLVAFSGNEEKVRQYMKKVEELSAELLDEHIICVCGRERVRTHLIEVSGDPDFFCGADPNVAVGYVSETFFPIERDGDESSCFEPEENDSGSGTQLGDLDALKELRGKFFE